MELVYKKVKILDESLKIGMTKDSWNFISQLKKEDRYISYSNVENLFLQAFLEYKKDITRSELGSIIMRWLYEAGVNKNEVVLAMLRPFPQDKPLVILPR
jgi:hypothetical protein